LRGSVGLYFQQFSQFFVGQRSSVESFLVLRINGQGGTAIPLRLFVVLLVLQTESSKCRVRVDDDVDLSEVRFAGDFRHRVLFYHEFDG
jgi:hypothetical protein